MSTSDTLLPHNRGIGFLNGVLSSTPNASITSLAPHVVRLPLSLHDEQAFRLASAGGLGVPTLQLIVGPQVLEERSALNSSALRAACWPILSPDCPLPGSAADPDYLHWESAVADAVSAIQGRDYAGAVRYDVWNEPNFVGGPGGGGGGWPFESKWYTPPPGRPAYTAFWETWNRAVRIIRREHPGAQIVGPSAAPGPGAGCGEGEVEGWQPQFLWMKQFLSMARASNTLPDILSWHDYTGDVTMAATMQSELRAWMASEDIRVGGVNASNAPMGYNEIVDSRHAQSAGYHVALAAALDRMQPPADHAVLGCFAEPGAGPIATSTCFDGSLDGSLDPNSSPPFKPRPVWYALQWYAQLPAARRLELQVQSSGGGDCALDGVASRLGVGENETLTILLGRWGAPKSTGAEDGNALVLVDVGPSQFSRCLRIQRLPACPGPITAPCPAAEPVADRPYVLASGPTGETIVNLTEAGALRIDVVVLTHNATCH